MNNDSTKVLQNMTPIKFFQYINDKRKPKCTNDEKILYNIPSNMFHLDLHNMTQLLIYSGMSNGYRISTDEFKNMNFLLTNLKSTYQMIDYEYSKMDRKEKEQYYSDSIILENDCLFNFLSLCGDYLEYNDLLHKHINIMRKNSLDSFFLRKHEPKKEPVVVKKLQKSPIQFLIDFYKQKHNEESITEFAIFLTDLYENTFVNNIPIEREIKTALKYIMFASQKNYKVNFKSPKTQKQWKECFVDFLSSIQEMNGWI
jgi:hypothetical protein